MEWLLQYGCSNSEGHRMSTHQEQWSVGLFVEDLSDGARPLPSAAGERVLTETIRCSLRQFDREHPDVAIFRTVTDPCRLKRGHRFTGSIAAASRWKRWLIGFRRPVPPSTASSMRCAPHRSENCRWTASATSSLPACTRGRRRPRSWGHCSKGICRWRSLRLPRMCPRIWPACMRCRC